MFFTFGQNNSGGSFINDGYVTHYVIVEADNADEANKIAENIGIYFDGCDQDMDCPCCGDRWSRQYGNRDGTEAPEIYGNPPDEEGKSDWFTGVGEVYCRVHYKDGMVEEFRKEE
jgi:hypothetical protein